MRGYCRLEYTRIFGTRSGNFNAPERGRFEANMTKWAQLSRIERAYKKAIQADGGGAYSCLNPRDRKNETKREKRGRNRYYQLLRHWCELRRLSDAGSSR